ncbi:Methyltransferase domain-containing protein [Raineyella antarctica]|uniref:Methyltransferase domain-containing protein n=1 Tax=Raineyella antarctica TaxID=1577474 RepID=A0A1G6GJ08_9ACTN|nr:class I SAM-dependent methyltransferase [Raineyella antarctica]SDB81166.1 Methyltransferase domain-containing protein [Raineyella antarctica]
MRPKSQWQLITETRPGHSQWYIERFKQMAAAGHDLFGEVRTVDAMAPRGARILDAGCGPGRVAGELARRGHDVLGVDVDPVLVEEAARTYAELPNARWAVGDVSDPDVAAFADVEPFDVIVCAGNVVTFMAEGTQRDALANFSRLLAPRGRAIIGFGLQRGYPYDTFRADIEAAGLAVHSLHSTWELHPFDPAQDDFVVAILGH